MSRRPTTAKHLIELYLIIVVGGYALAFLVGFIANGLTDGDFGEMPGFLVALTCLTAGIGIYRVRPWGLVLAIIMAVLIIFYSVSERRLMGVWDYHDFTITLPMALVLVWALLPPTWAEFQKREIKTP